MKISSVIILLNIVIIVDLQAQTNHKTIKSNKEPLNAQFMAEYLTWGDKKILTVLENLNEEEFHRPFNELSGNIHSKTAHILSIYEFFVAILENRPHQGFPSLDRLTKDELIAKWKEFLKVWPQKVKNIQEGLYALPLANNQRVDVQHIYLDTFAHTIHHRGQLLTFIRLLGKNKEEIHPRDINTDYLMFVFSENKQFIHPAQE